MIRSGLYILLIGVFVMGSARLIPPLISTANAITAEEMLADPLLENRARNLSQKLRCLVCQNQSIDDSDADLAKDLRREVRAQLVQGKTDEAILSDLRAKYGDLFFWPRHWRKTPWLCGWPQLVFCFLALP